MHTHVHTRTRVPRICNMTWLQPNMQVPHYTHVRPNYMFHPLQCQLQRKSNFLLLFWRVSRLECIRGQAARFATHCPAGCFVWGTCAMPCLHVVSCPVVPSCVVVPCRACHVFCACMSELFAARLLFLLGLPNMWSACDDDRSTASIANSINHSKFHRWSVLEDNQNWPLFLFFFVVALQIEGVIQTILMKRNSDRHHNSSDSDDSDGNDGHYSSSQRGVADLPIAEKVMKQFKKCYKPMSPVAFLRGNNITCK